MTNPTLINLLLIDDSEDQLILIEDELLQNNFQPTIKRVCNAEALEQSLQQLIAWDIALLDYRMPGFSAENALLIVQHYAANLPVIVLSGQVSEENAVKMMRSGADDYISKQHRLRLIPSIMRELKRSTERREQAGVALKLRETEQKLSVVVNAAQEGIFLLDEGFKIDFWNAAAEKITGYSVTDIYAKSFIDKFIPADLQAACRQKLSASQLTIPKEPKTLCSLEFALTMKNGNILTVEVSIASVEIKNNWTGIGIIRDINQRKQLETQLKLLSTHDPLTNLINHRELMLCLNQEIQRAIRYATPLSIFFIDIDDFKKVNDQHGHQMGDTVLTKLAELMQSSMREIDIIGRYGGEEFLIILPETPIVKSAELAERLRFLAAQLIFDLEEDKSLSITLSIGIAEFDRQNSQLESLIENADKAMYQAKTLGKNQIYLAQ